MGIFDFMKKKGGAPVDGDQPEDKKEEIPPIQETSPTPKMNFKELLQGVDTSKLSIKQKMAMKMFQKLPADKQEEYLRKAMNPQAVQKNKAEVLQHINQMVKSGQIDKNQAEAIKRQMGLR